jgi:hypothetical protein
MCTIVYTSFLQEKLHSVKWYRIDHRGHMQEFYSYKPGNIPPAKRHLLTGIKVDVRLRRLKQEFLTYSTIFQPF